MHRHSIVLAVLLTLVTLAGAQQKDASSGNSGSQPPVPTFSMRLPSEETINGFMHETFGYDSSVTWKILEVKPALAENLAQVEVLLSSGQGQQVQRFYVTSDGKHAVVGDIIPFGEHPFAPVQESLLKGMTGFALGPADAPVTIFEFSDLQCPYCKQAQPTIDKLIAEEKNVRLVFQNFPLPAHNWAAKGAYYADCVGQASMSQATNDAFWKFIHSAFESQTEITPDNADAKLTALADQAGVKGSDIAACAAKPETAGRVQRSIALGRSVEVNGTPTLFINGRKVSNVGGVPYDVLKSLVEFAAKKE
ncbi:MAG TPA: thioredoxin domain-containing protein [Terriglobales bacterium]|nr:thioredoxin domain-containing protein [Terriglobales bacterium]